MIDCPAERRCAELEAENQRMSQALDGYATTIDTQRADLAACARLVEVAADLNDVGVLWDHRCPGGGGGDCTAASESWLDQLAEALSAIPEPTRQRLAELVKE